MGNFFEYSFLSTGYFSIAKQPEVMIINNLVLQQYFSAIFYVFIQFLIKFADKML